MKSNRFSVLVISICLVLALSLVSFIGASAAPTSNEVTSTSAAPARADAIMDEGTYGSCTQGFVLGLSSLIGNMNGQTMDPGVSPDFRWSGPTLVIPEEGNRYFSGMGGLNEKGVSRTGGFRPVQMFPPYPGTPPYVGWSGMMQFGDELMRTSDSAAEYVASWSEYVTEYGNPTSSDSLLIVDPKEGYFLEVVNFVYGDPANHNIIGPMTDQVFAAANFMVSERLKAYEAGIGAGYTRAKRAWELLIDRQYDCIVMQPSPPAPGGGISLPYLMSVWRDHGNISPQEMRMSCYVAEERGVESICQHGILERTGYAVIDVSRADHTGLLSCQWTTCNSPCISPYLPFYIGINEVPEIASGPGNPLGEVFAELRLAVERHPEYWDEITQYWTVWEIQTIEESYGVEQEAAHLWDDGDEAEARDVLTEFVEEKCSEALEIGEDMLDFLNGLPMFEGFAEAEEAGPPYGVGPEESEKPEK
jgi:hypothetical protein